MKKMTREEKNLESALIKGEFKDVGKSEFEAIAQSVAARKKDAVLNIRVNREDLENIKRRAKQYGIRYQTFISEWFHRIAS